MKVELNREESWTVADVDRKWGPLERRRRRRDRDGDDRAFVRPDLDHRSLETEPEVRRLWYAGRWWDGCRLESKLQIVLKDLVGALETDAAREPDAIEGPRLQRILWHEDDRPAVLLESALDRGLNGKVRGKVQDAVLVEGDLDPGVDRHLRRLVARQRRDHV